METKICLAPRRAALMWIMVTAVGLAYVPTASRALGQPGGVGLELPGSSPANTASASDPLPHRDSVPGQALLRPEDLGLVRFPLNRPSEPPPGPTAFDQAVKLGLPVAVDQSSGPLTVRASSVPLVGLSAPNIKTQPATPSGAFGPVSLFGSGTSTGTATVIGGTAVGCGDACGACGVVGCCEGGCCDRSWKHFGQGWKGVLHKHCTPAPAGPVCDRYYGQEPAIAQPTWSWYGWGGPIAPAVNAPAYASVPTQYQPAPYFNPPSVVPSVTYGPVNGSNKTDTEKIDEQNNRANPPKRDIEPDPLGPPPKDAPKPSQNAPAQPTPGAEPYRFLGPPSTQLPGMPTPGLNHPGTVEPPLYRGPSLPTTPGHSPIGMGRPIRSDSPTTNAAATQQQRGSAMPASSQHSPYGGVRPAHYTPAYAPAPHGSQKTSALTQPQLQPRLGVPDAPTQAPDIGGNALLPAPLKTGVKPGTIVPTYGSATAGQQLNSVPPYTPPVNRPTPTASYVRTQPQHSPSQSNLDKQIVSTQSVGTQSVANTSNRPVVGLARPIVARGVAPEAAVGLAAPKAAPASAKSTVPTQAPTATPTQAPATPTAYSSLRSNLRSALGGAGDVEDVRIVGEGHLFVKLRVHRPANPEQVVNQLSRLRELQAYRVDFEVHLGQ